MLWRRPLAQKGLSASAIRCKILNGEPWEDDVPPAVRRLVKTMNLSERLAGEEGPRDLSRQECEPC